MIDSATFTFTITTYRTGSGDGRGGNARDRRRARRAGRTWRSLVDVVRAQTERARKDLNESMGRAVWHGTGTLWGLNGYPRLRAGVDASATATHPTTAALPAITTGIKL